MMNFDFYLSEMSISDLHGGGLTLQRVIGDDLMHIRYFAHVKRFAYDLPATEKFADRAIDLTSVWESDIIRNLIGRTFAASLSNKLFIIKRTAKNAARLLNSKFEKSEAITGLVCPQGMASIYTLEALKSYRRVRYISWVMDDHLIQYNNGKWDFPKGVEQVFKKHLQDADHVFVISTAMQDFYKSRFGINSTVLFSSADLSTQRGRPVLDINAALKIGYFGAVSAWQLDPLLAVANSLNGTNTQFHIYSAIENLPDELCVGGVYFKGRLDPGEVLHVMQNYDAILLPVSFKDEMRSLSTFNIATKMSEYLASGVPILAIGPAYAAMIQYLKTNDAALLVESGNEDDIKNAFKLFNDKAKISAILENAKNLVLNETGTLPMRKRWEEALNKLPS